MSSWKKPSKTWKKLDKLLVFPALGRKGRVRDTRVWAVPNWSYLIPYRLRGDRLQILGGFTHGNPSYQVVRANPRNNKAFVFLLGLCFVWCGTRSRIEVVTIYK